MAYDYWKVGDFLPTLPQLRVTTTTQTRLPGRKRGDKETGKTFSISERKSKEIPAAKGRTEGRALRSDERRIEPIPLIKPHCTRECVWWPSLMETTTRKRKGGNRSCHEKRGYTHDSFPPFPKGFHRQRNPPLYLKALFLWRFLNRDKSGREGGEGGDEALQWDLYSWKKDEEWA